MFHPPLNSHHNFNSLPEVDLGLTPNEEVDRFLQLRLQLKSIEMELEAFKPNIVTRCEQAGGKIITPLGSIGLSEHKSWQYSEQVELLKLKLIQLQKEEKQNRKAQTKAVTVTPVVRLNGFTLIENLAPFLSGVQRDPEFGEQFERRKEEGTTIRQSPWTQSPLTGNPAS